MSPDLYLESMRRFSLIVICILLGTSLFSQQYNKYSSSYNFKKAIASIQQSNENYGEALSTIEYAIKYIPIKDKEYKSLSLYKRAGIYVALNESDKALKDFTSAIYYQSNLRLS